MEIFFIFPWPRLTAISEDHQRATVDRIPSTTLTTLITLTLTTFTTLAKLLLHLLHLYYTYYIYYNYNTYYIILHTTLNIF